VKRIISVCIAALFILTSIVGVSAAGSEKWKNLGHYLDQSDGVMTETADGLQIDIKGYYRADGNYAGFILKDPVTLDGFSIEIKVLSAPIESTDAWLGIDFMAKPAALDITAPEGNPGFVSLIRPSSDGDVIMYQGFELVDSFDFKESINIDGPYVTTYTMEVKKTATGYSFILNGNAHDYDYATLLSVFPDGKAYPLITSSDVDELGYSYVITKINGQPVVTPDAPPPVVEEAAPAAVVEEAPAPAPAAPAPVAPRVGDSMVIVLVMMMIASAGVVVFRKKISVK